MAKGMNPIQSRAVVKLKLPLAGVLTLAAMIVMSLPAGAAGLGVARPVISSKIAAAAPGLVDLGAVRTAHKGDVIALGRLVDASGNAASGMVAALALPGDKIEKSLKVGDSVPWPTIGAAATAADGTFTIQADSGSVPPGYWQNGKVVNVKLIGWNESSVTSSNLPARPIPTLSLFPPAGREDSCARVSRATITACAARPTMICSCVPVNGLGR